MTPYNYVIDKNASVNLQNKIFIVDEAQGHRYGKNFSMLNRICTPNEAHHLPRRLEDRNSFSITTSALQKAYGEIETCIMEGGIVETARELKRMGKKTASILKGKKL